MKDPIPRGIKGIATYLAQLPRSKKRLLMMLVDFVGIPAAMWCALTLRLGTMEHGEAGGPLVYVIALVTSVPVFGRLGLYRAVIRYLGHRVILTVVVGVTVSVAILTVFDLAMARQQFPLGALAIYWSLAVIYVAGTRLTVRSLLNIHWDAGRQRVAIYGAGAAGAQLAVSLQRGGQFNPVAFVDDNRLTHRSIVAGIEVFSPARLRDLVADQGVSTVLLAMPSSTRRRRNEILKKLEPLGVHVQTVPDFSSIFSGKGSIADIRDVDAGDLLGRDPVPPDTNLLDACIKGRVVMVTGAGGSIGSELCRQIFSLSPTRLILFEASELALYQIERELTALAKKTNSLVDVVALLGNAHHKQRLKHVIQSYAVQTIYHAAAYKHVPIVEQNIVEGIHNNIFSTWYAAEAALECKVESFVLVSTDKAVHPTNVMGATKRAAELVLQGLQERTSSTRFCMVRFGNVLESSGSVVPLFREQIQRGGPVTVTHRDVIRYFMTIPEAAQLVLQAGSMAMGGDVFVLNMGNPVRIDDLARRMISLMGLCVKDDENPDGDIEIVYTGLRPAEKLYEELLIGDDVTGTEHSMIMRAMEHSLPWTRVRQALDRLLEALSRSDCGLTRDLLMDLVAEYQPVGGIQDLVWKVSAPSEPDNVTELQPRRHKVPAQISPL